MSYKPESFSILTAAVDKSRGGKFTAALSYLSSNVKPYLDKKIAAGPKGSEKKLWEQCHNLVTSFLEGAASGDVSNEDLKELSRDLRNAEKAHTDRLYKVKEAKGSNEQAMPAVRRDAKDKNAERVDEHNYDGAPDKYDAGSGAVDVFRKYEVFKAKAASDTKKQFIAVRMPIVVLSAGIPDIGKLKRTGICDDLLFGYPVLKNQVLIGLHSEFLIQFTPGWSKYQKQVKDNVTVTQSLKIEWDKVNDLLSSMLKEKTGRSFVMLGKTGHKYGKLNWIWMAESRELQRLNGTTGQATFSVTDWGFPFESEMRGIRHNPRVSER